MLFTAGESPSWPVQWSFGPYRGPMFDSLTQKLSQAMKSLRGQSKLTEANLEGVLREVRMALLEADVHVSVARTFLQRVKEKALGAEVM